MQTILGAGGPAGRALFQELTKTPGARVRLVRRHAAPVPAGVELFRADLTDPERTEEALRDTRVAYLTVGLPYRTRVWARDWPRIMENVIRAAARHGARLVFLDNVYMYAPEALGDMTEASPIGPVSRKGRIRAKLAARLEAAIKAGEVEALIARSADFYGYEKPATGILNRLVFEPLARGRPAFWPGRLDVPHSFTYLPDLGRALARLGQTPAAFGQVWHLPTAPALTGRAWVAAVATALERRPRALALGRTLAWLMGFLDADVRESREMLYQFERPYVFKSEKIERALGEKPTPVATALAKIAAVDYGIRAPGGSPGAPNKAPHQK